MCGRYWLVTPADVLASRFRVRGEIPPLLPRWNAAPGQDLPVVRLDAATGARVLEPMRWGLVPAWAARPEDAGRPINARAETAAGKPTFKDPLRRSRALVPADGFFEWRKGDRGRDPVAFRLKSRRPFAFAGIFDTWTPRTGPALKTFAILTTRPNELVAGVHDRMPLILPPEGEGRWLDPGVQEPDFLSPLLAPPGAGEMEAFPVSRRVNTPANDDASVLEPPGPEAPPSPRAPAAPEAQRGFWENEDDDRDDEGGADVRAERGRRVPVPAVLLLAAAGCAALGGGARSSASPPPTPAAPAAPKLGPQKAMAIANGYTAGFQGLRRRFWEESSEGFQRAFSFNPTDDVAAYLAALSTTQALKAGHTLEWLNELWRLNSCLMPLPKSFGPGLNDPRVQDVLALLKAQAPKTHRSTARFTLGARDLVPGGLAWDAAGKVFYVASLRKRKIVRVTPGAPGAAATASDFSAAGELDAVLGVKVDRARRRLWAVTAVDPAMEGFRTEDFGRSALVALDLATGAVVGRWAPMTTPPHELGGLALDAAGNVWVADTASGEVHVLRAGAERLAAVARRGTFVAPKGIAVSTDGTHVYVSDLARGVYLLDPATGDATVLDQPAGPWPAGLDGLVLHRNALVGVAGSVSLGRVGRWTLEPDGNSFAKIEILDCAHPSYRVPVGGTVAGDDYVYVANSQVDAVAADGSLPSESLEDLVFLRLPLGP